MLTWLRKKQKFILKWTLILVIPSFIAFYGWSSITGADQSAEDPSAWWIRIRGDRGGWHEITQWDFRQARDTLLDRYAGMMQSSFGPQAAQMVRQIEGQISNERVALEAIDNAILRRYARDRGITVTDDEVAQAIQRQFRGLTAAQARQYLANQRISEQQFAALTAYNLLLDKARREITAPAFVSVYEVWQEYSLAKQRVQVAALEINQADYMDDVVVDETALKEFYTANIENYRIPEMRTYEYVKIDRLALREEVVINDEDLKAYYDANSEEFAIKEAVKVRQIVLSLPPDAEEIAIEARREQIAQLAQRARDGEDFAALADEFTEDFTNTFTPDPASTETIKLGGLIDEWITAESGRYGEEFLDAALALEPAQITDPIRTPRGWVVLKGEEKREREIPAFDEISDRVEGVLRDKKARDLYNEQKTKLATAISDLTDFEEIAGAAGLRVQKTEPQNATNYFFPNIGNLSSYEIYFTDLLQGDLVAGIMEIPNTETPNTAVFMRLDRIDPTRLPDLEEARARVEGDLKRKRALEIAKAKAEELAAQSPSIDDLTRIAEEMGKSLKATNELVTLEEVPAAGLPRIQDFAADLVRTPPLKARVSPIIGFFGDEPNGYAVWIITEKQEADRAAFREELPQLQAELLNIKRQTLLNEFLASRRAELRIEYNPQILGDLAAAQ